jgi:hypothetical protein
MKMSSRAKIITRDNNETISSQYQVPDAVVEFRLKKKAELDLMRVLITQVNRR